MPIKPVKRAYECTLPCGCKIVFVTNTGQALTCPLHSAAPDLLAVCKNIVREHRLFYNSTKRQWVCPICGALAMTALGFTHNDTCGIEMAKAAIAAAEQEQFIAAVDRHMEAVLDSVDVGGQIIQKSNP